MKRVLANLAGQFGYEIRRKQPQQAESVLSSVNFATVLDVGANEGQFSSAFLSSHPAAIVHAFEPIPACFSALQARFSGNSKFQAHNLAMSDCNTVAEFELNEYSQSSSLLELDEMHKQLYPDARKTTKISVNMVTLDSWAEGRALQRPLLLKLDVQGNEHKVLKGAAAVLPEVDFVLAEVSMAPLYKGQASFREIHDLLSRSGMEFIDLFPEKRDADTRRCVFGDVIFERKAN